MAIRLYVVYAGRGDALILEDGEALLPIDGGPLGFSPGDTSGAPYYKYYRTTLWNVAAAMGRGTRPLSLDGVLVSHADEDHYGGIVRLLQRELRSGGLTVAGPLVTQVLRPPLNVGERALRRALEELDFVLELSAGQPLARLELAPLPRFWVYRRPPSTPAPGGRAWTVDTSANNLASVLAFHRGRGMLFTGDSTGYLIRRFMSEGAMFGDWPVRGEMLALFKLPHHGSMRNAQRDMTLGSVPPYAWQQYALLCIVAAPTERAAIWLPPALDNRAALTLAGSVLTDVCTTMSVNLATLRSALRTAFDSTIAEIAARAANPFRRVDAIDDVPIESVWQEVRRRLVVHRQVRGFGKTRRVRPSRRSRAATQLEPLSSAWFTALTAPAISDTFLGALAYEQLKAFFEGFVALNYAVSADGNYRHPSAETIAALAAAAARRGQRAQLFATDGSAVDLGRIEAINPGWQTGLAIRFLIRGAALTLDLTCPENAIAPERIDPERTAGPLIFAAGARAIHDQLKRGDIVIPPIPFHGPMPMDAAVIASGPAPLSPGRYLNLSAAGVLSVGDEPQELLLQDASTISVTQPASLPFPASFDDVLMQADADAAAVAGFSLLEPAAGEQPGALIALQRPLAAPQYVSVNAGEGFLTPDPQQAARFALKKRPRADDAARAQDVAAPAGPGTLRAFCEAVGAPLERPLSCAELLPWLVGPDDAPRLLSALELPTIVRVLSWSALLDDSTVEWSLDERGPFVQGATVAIELGEPRTFTIDGREETILSAQVTLARDASGALVASAGVHATEGVRLLQDATVEEPARTVVLDEYLADLGVPVAQRPLVTLGTLLTAMTGAEDIVETLLVRAPSFVIRGGLGEWLLDHAASSVELRLLPSGAIGVAFARIVTRTPAAIVADVEGLALTLSRIVLTVRDAGLPGMEVTLEAQAASSGPPLTLLAPLSEEGCTFELALPPDATLTELAALLPATAPIGELAVPPTGTKLSDLAPAQLTILASQPTPGAEPYLVDAIRAAVTFDDWRAALALGWPPPAAGDGTPSVRVLAPLDAANRRVALDVELALTVAGKPLAAELSAAPLPVATGQAWSWSVRAWPELGEDGFTAAELLGAVGLANQLDELPAALPALQPVLGEQAVAALALVYDVSDGGEPAPATELELGLVLLSPWELLPGIATLGPSQVALRWFEGAWSGEGEAQAVVGPEALVAAQLQLPTPSQPGAMSFSLGDEAATLGAFASACGLGDLSVAPLVAAWLPLPLAEAELLLAYPGGGGALALAGAGLLLQAPPLQVGVLALEAVAVTVERLLPSTGQDAAFAWWLEGEWATVPGAPRSYVASIWFHDAQPDVLTGQLRPLAQAPLGALLEGLLGTQAQSTLLPAVAPLQVFECTLALRVPGFALTSFAARLTAATELRLGVAVLSDLTARWVAASNEAAEVYRLEGTIAAGERRALIAIEFRSAPEQEGLVAATLSPLPGAAPLTAPDVLALLDLTRPDVLVPDGAPPFDELPVTRATILLTVDPRASDPLALQQLTLVVATDASLQALAAPPIELTQLTLQLDYDRGLDPPGSGFVTGTLTLDDVGIVLRYARAEDGVPEFGASVTFAPPQRAPDYARLNSKPPYEPDHGLPEGLALPAAIPLTSLTAVARPGAYVEVSGFDPATTWGAPLDRLAPAVEALGGRVQVREADGVASWAVELFGQLTYEGFVGAGATFAFGPNAPNVLSAASSSDPAAIALPAVASAVGPPWEALIPLGTPAIRFARNAWTYVEWSPADWPRLEPASGVLALYGALADGLEAGMLRSVPDGDTRRSVFALHLQAPFLLGALWPALGQLVDPYVSLRAANAAVIGLASEPVLLAGDVAAVEADALAQQTTWSPPLADLPPLPQALPPGTRLAQGLWLFAALDLAGPGTLSGALARIADPAAMQGPIVVWGAVAHDAPERSVFSLALAGLTLLGARVVLEGVARYAPSAAETFVVEAGVAVTIGAAAPYTFHGTLTIGVEQASFASGDPARQPAAIVEPFGMTGVTLDAPRLTLEASYPAGAPTTLTLRIDGEVELRIGTAAQTFAGAIHFLDGVPVVAAVAVTTAFDVRDLTTDLIPTGAWPEGYAPFELLEPLLSDADVATGSITVDGHTYPAGYHAVGGARFLGGAFDADATVERTGIALRASASETLDFAYLRLSAASVAIDTTNPNATVYELQADAAVFGAAFEPARFAWQPGEGRWHGTATYAGTVVEVLRPLVAFECPAEGGEGMRIADWHVAPMLGEDQLDWEATLEAATRNSECGQLTDLPLDQKSDDPPQTRFDLRLSQTGAIAGGQLPLVLRGTYTLVVDGAETGPLLMPDVHGSIAAPASFKLDGLYDWCVETLRAQADALARNLLEARIDDAPALKHVVEPADMSDASQELMQALLCREVDPENVRERTEALIEQGAATIGGDYGEAGSQAASSSGSSSVGGAGDASSLAGLALGSLSSGCGAAGSLAPLVGFAGPWLSPSARAAWDGALAGAGPATEAVGAAYRRVQDLLAMRGVPSVAFTPEGGASVAWTSDNEPASPGIAYDYSALTYRVDLFADPELTVLLGSGTTTGGSSVTFDPATVGERTATVYAFVRATIGSFEGWWIAGTATRPIPLPAPARVAQRLDEGVDAVVVSVASVAGALDYVVELIDAAHGDALVASQRVPAPSPSPAAVEGTFAADALPALAAGARLLARACASGDPAIWLDSPFTRAPAEQAAATLPAPVVQEALFRSPETDVRATWASVAGATGYVLSVTGLDGARLVPSPTIAYDPDQMGATVSGEVIAAGRTYELRVRAAATGVLALWSAPVVVQAQVVPAPGDVTLAYGEATLVAEWEPLPQATDYRVELALAPSTLVAEAHVSAPPVLFSAQTGTRLVTGASYVLNVRAVVGSSEGPSAAAAGYVPTPLEIARASWDMPLPIERPARELHALVPTIGPAQLWDTLEAGGYAAAEATAGVRLVLPATTTETLLTIAGALGDLSAMTRLLLAEGVASAVIVALCQAIRSPVPVQLAVAFKQAGVPADGLAQSFEQTFWLPPADAQQLVEGVYNDATQLGPPLWNEGQRPEDACTLVHAAWPAAPLIEVVAVVLAAGYAPLEARVRSTLLAIFLEVSQVDYELLVPAIRDDDSGFQLACRLRGEGVERGVATACVHAVFPALESMQVQQAIERAWASPECSAKGEQ